MFTKVAVISLVTPTVYQYTNGVMYMYVPKLIYRYVAHGLTATYGHIFGGALAPLVGPVAVSYLAGPICAGAATATAAATAYLSSWVIDNFFPEAGVKEQKKPSAVKGPEHVPALALPADSEPVEATASKPAVDTSVDCNTSAPEEVTPTGSSATCTARSIMNYFITAAAAVAKEGLNLASKVLDLFLGGAKKRLSTVAKVVEMEMSVIEVCV